MQHAPCTLRGSSCPSCACPHPPPAAGRTKCTVQVVRRLERAAQHWAGPCSCSPRMPPHARLSAAPCSHRALRSRQAVHCRGGSGSSGQRLLVARQAAAPRAWPCLRGVHAELLLWVLGCIHIAHHQLVTAAPHRHHRVLRAGGVDRRNGWAHASQKRRPEMPCSVQGLLLRCGRADTQQWNMRAWRCGLAELLLLSNRPTAKRQAPEVPDAPPPAPWGARRSPHSRCARQSG